MINSRKNCLFIILNPLLKFTQVHLAIPFYFQLLKDFFFLYVSKEVSDFPLSSKLLWIQWQTSISQIWIRFMVVSYLLIFHLNYFFTIPLQFPTLLFLLCNRTSSLNNALLLVNSLYTCGFLAMVNFHLLYIHPYLYRAWGNPLSLWHREKTELQRKKNRKYIGKSCRKLLPIFFKISMLTLKK